MLLHTLYNIIYVKLPSEPCRKAAYLEDCITQLTHMSVLQVRTHNVAYELYCTFMEFCISRLWKTKHCYTYMKLRLYEFQRKSSITYVISIRTYPIWKVLTYVRKYIRTRDFTKPSNMTQQDFYLFISRCHANHQSC